MRNPEYIYTLFVPSHQGSFKFMNVRCQKAALNIYYFNHVFSFPRVCIILLSDSVWGLHYSQRKVLTLYTSQEMAEHCLARIIHHGVGLGIVVCLVCERGVSWAERAQDPLSPKSAGGPGVAKFEFAEGSTGIASSG